MNEDTKLNSEEVPEKKDETQNDELDGEQLDGVAGGIGGFHGSSKP
jgi:hypothetical protein